MAIDNQHLFELLEHPKELLPSIETLQYNNASIGTPSESSVGQTIADFIHHVLDKD